MSLIDYFAIFGLEKINHNSIFPEPEYLLDNIEIFSYSKPVEKEKDTRPIQWIDIDDKKQNYLKCTYSKTSINPITALNIYKIMPIQNDIHVTLQNTEPAPYHIIPDTNEENKSISPKSNYPKILVGGKPENEIETTNSPQENQKEKDKKKFSFRKVKKENSEIYIFQGNYDVSKILCPETKFGIFILGIFFSRNPDQIPIVNVKIVTEFKNNTESAKESISGYSKYVPFKFGETQDKYKTIYYTMLDMFESSYHSNLLSRYPLENRKTLEFPKSAGTFIFPAGIKMISQKLEPKFGTSIMTNEKGVTVFCIFMVIYEGICSKIKDTLTKFKNEYLFNLFAPKAICIISKYSCVTGFRELLKSIMRMQQTELEFPLEEFICFFIHKLPYIQSGILEFIFQDSHITFVKPPWQSSPFADKEIFEVLMTCLSCENVIKIVGAMLLDRKIVLISTNPTLLNFCSIALLNLLYPFEWRYTMIPVLPKKLLPILDAPVIYLIGIDGKIESAFQYIPSDAIKVYLDKNTISIEEPLTPLHGKQFTKILNRIKSVWKPDPKILEKLDSIEGNSLASILNLEEMENRYLEIKDSFLKLISRLLRDYNLHMQISKNQSSEMFQFNDIFSREGFLTSVSGKKELSIFMDQFTQTGIFVGFIESHQISPKPVELIFFEEYQNFEKEQLETKEKKKYPFDMSSLNKVIVTFTTEKNQSGQPYKYSSFPILNFKNIKAIVKWEKEDPENINKIDESFDIFEKTIKFNYPRFNIYEWSMCILENIFELWFHLFLHSIIYYKKYIKESLSYAKKILDEIKEKYDIKNLEEISKYFLEIYDFYGFSEEKQTIFKDLMNSQFTLSHKDAINYFIGSSTDSRPSIMSLEEEETPKNFEEIKEKLFKSVIELDVICSHCDHAMTGEELIKGFPRNVNELIIRCTNDQCKKNFTPHLKVIMKNKVPEIIILLSPLLLKKEVTNMEKNSGNYCFFKQEFFEKSHEIVFWNLLFYFRLMMLTIVMFDIAEPYDPTNLYVSDLYKSKKTSFSRAPSIINTFNFKRTQIKKPAAAFALKTPKPKEGNLIMNKKVSNVGLLMGSPSENVMDSQSISYIFGPLFKSLILQNKAIMKTYSDPIVSNPESFSIQVEDKDMKMDSSNEEIKSTENIATGSSEGLNAQRKNFFNERSDTINYDQMEEEISANPKSKKLQISSTIYI